MKIEKRIEALAALGKALHHVKDDELHSLCSQIKNNNAWFQQDDSLRALQAILAMLDQQTLWDWVSRYKRVGECSKKTIGLIMAGNIPAVGFHDYLAVLLCGHRAQIKLSNQDQVLLPFIHSVLKDIAPLLAEKITFVDKISLDALDGIIATGSDNSARYFESYFQKIPHVIRKNRSSIAILTGKETKEELTLLAKDVLWYYGLGCRNVSKLFVPQDYDLKILLDAFEDMKDYILYQNKYINNYDYNKSIYLVNGVAHLDNGFLLLKEANELISPISVLHYERYEDEKQISWDSEKVQCVVGKNHISFGQAQSPSPWDYADGVDIIDFLIKL